MYLILNAENKIIEICRHPSYVRRQKNGVAVLCDKEHADALYSNDSNSFYPVDYFCDRYRIEEVDTVPNHVVAKYYHYCAGVFYTDEKLLAALNASSDADRLLLDHEYRLTILEILGGE